jgi:hypothetical protein
VPLTPEPARVIAPVLVPLHKVRLFTAFAVGVGLAVMLNVWVDPEQLRPPNVNTGVTVILDTFAVVPELATLNEDILPLPLAARPIDVLLLAQLKTVPIVVPLKLTTAVAAPLHKTWLDTGFTFGTGFTWKVIELLVEVAADGQIALLVIEQVIISLVCSVLVVYVLPVAPLIGIPFLFH